jgi:hypothetical protein
MKGLRFILLALLITAAVPVANADQIPTNDPRVKTGGGPPLSIDDLVPAAIITLDFTVESPSGTSPGTSPCILMQGGINTVSPQCLFQNEVSLNGTGLTITALTFDALGINPDSVTCGFLSGSPFSQCGVDPLSGNAGAEISFFDGAIPFGSDFTLDFEGFPQDFSFGTTAGATPDPGTFSLVMLGGLAALIARRKLRKAYHQ